MLRRRGCGEKDEEKYLRDLISKDGRNLKNIKARVNKGKGIVQKILNILDGIPFGKLYFQVAVLLRNSLLVSSLLCNSEAWFNLTHAELELLESVDLMLLRSIMKAPKSTPKEMFFLELGVLPLREMIRERRLHFVHYILSQEENSLIVKVFEKQLKNCTAKDWVKTVIDDLEKVGLNVTFEEIKSIRKAKWKSMVKKSITEHSFTYLENIKQSHSKVKELEYEKLKTQTYFLPNKLNIYKEDIHLIFRMRCKVVNLKMNMKGIYDAYECKVCQNEDESQEHVYECKEIWKLRKKDYLKIPSYEKIMNGSVKEKLEVSRILRENMIIPEKFKAESK